MAFTATKATVLLLLFLFALLIATNSTDPSADDAAISVPKPKIKACMGKDLDPTDPVRVGTLLKKECSPFSKSAPRDFVRLNLVAKLFSSCEIILDTKYDAEYPIALHLGSTEMPMEFMKNVGRMCVGEKRRITAPGHSAYGNKTAGVTMIHDFVFPSNSTIVWEVELLEISKEPPNDYFSHTMKTINTGVTAFGEPESNASADVQEINTWRRNAKYIPGWAEDVNQMEIMQQLKDQWVFRVEYDNSQRELQGIAERASTDFDQFFGDKDREYYSNLEKRQKRRHDNRVKRGMTMEL
jgi:hypothetical protein